MAKISYNGENLSMPPQTYGSNSRSTLRQAQGERGLLVNQESLRRVIYQRTLCARFCERRERQRTGLPRSLPASLKLRRASKTNGLFLMNECKGTPPSFTFPPEGGRKFWLRLRRLNRIVYERGYCDKAQTVRVSRWENAGDLDYLSMTL